MKIVARIRQLLSAKEGNIVADVVERVPLTVARPPEPTLRRAVEHEVRPATPRPLPLAAVPLTKRVVRLEGEGIEHPIVAPSEDIIRRELDRLRSSGPSHLALIAPDGSYLQAAGNAERMTVEVRLVSPPRTTHVVLGRQQLSDRPATIVSTAGPIKVRASEVWTALEAVDLFSVFAATISVSPDLSQRDITAAIAGP